jgi:hypothetical protein
MIESPENIIVGKTRVKSLNTGALGTISAVFLEAKREDRYDSIEILWDHGKISNVFLMNTDYVEIV